MDSNISSIIDKVILSLLSISTALALVSVFDEQIVGCVFDYPAMSTFLWI